ncbi:4'-phosphopantetheinyl transferase superfamily protein [Paenibacillus sp. CF095]|uniref:4'-phosphopantetheinyl transferase family protein n=1 Tax=Paenibacillus sp. CF095 TaxID=1881033 RepID=UPI00088D6BE6|nr:4'-phosphopantetheinyl transferase superfamily protein [Paenibacillus sp. CF095]SDD51822.1 4'-phosphopantetheinyl transferase superfamily protein [Paenibacillus sp. CF095]
MSRPKSSFKASICIGRFALNTFSKETIHYLHEEELDYYSSLQIEKRKRSFLMGRFCAKKAIQLYTDFGDYRKIIIRRGVFQQPVVNMPLYSNIQVSITHCNDMGAALAFSEEHAMGIDIEKISRDASAIDSIVTIKERNLIKTLSLDSYVALYLMWTAKEALSKILKTGFTTPPQIFEINRIDIHSDHVSSEYTNFSQFMATSFQAGYYMISIAHPKRTIMDLQTLNDLIYRMHAISSFH